jgi:hypothetical protein
MKLYRVEMQLHTFSISTLDGTEWLASSPGRFTPVERVAGTHRIRGFVGPSAGMSAVEMWKSLAIARNRTPIPQLSSL